VAQVQDTTTTMTLQEFLASPLADEEPSWEYLPGGTLARKVSPSTAHSIVQAYLAHLFLSYRERTGVEIDVLTEGRAVLSQSSPVPDMTVYVGRFELDESGNLERYPSRPPTITIEIFSPGQTTRQLANKCRDMIRGGASVGLVVDPRRRELTLVTLAEATTFRGDQVIPFSIPELDGFRLTPDDAFASLP
jgi:Uma2 family endonuclease